MRAERFGSYSIAATFAGISFLSRRKSTIRYFCLWPPPWCRHVMAPWLFRPPVACFFSTSRRSGFFGVRSSFVRTVIARTPGEVGLNFRIPMAIVSFPSRPSHAFEELDLFARLQGHDGLLPPRAKAHGPPAALDLPGHVHRPDLDDLHLEQLLHGFLDLLLLRAPVDFEGHGVRGPLEEGGLFRDQRPLEDVGGDHVPSTSVIFSSAGRVSTSWS